jgi:hypothetical protein
LINFCLATKDLKKCCFKFFGLWLYFRKEEKIVLFGAKRTKNLGAFRIRPNPLTGRGGILWWLIVVLCGLPLHPTRLGVVGVGGINRSFWGNMYVD